ncbi:hypothetical protein BS50DRAFT_642962 [Corynespora cassiicola Philippines]|uniref:Uncharacterized protein n=1 Tax=Corynespora cassiicola Philippines TaxID=1448308 RepID=A0A2T2PAA6_CORCC|nr:hypothetical protein BS50DRAFT_642962 [Corynespora cassiicola Philippines]
MPRVRPNPRIVIYPKKKWLPNETPCLDKSFPYEHALKCGHLVVTDNPFEPCGSNCQHTTGVDPQEIRNFFCDACVEEFIWKKKQPKRKHGREVSVSCDRETGDVNGYMWLGSHLHDSAFPQTGPNMFEGIEPCENDDSTLPKTDPNMSEDIEAFENDRVISVKLKRHGEA